MFTRFRVFWVLVLNTNFWSRSRNPALHFELFPGERFPEVEWLAQRPWTFFRPGIHIAKFLSPRGLCHFSLPLTLLLIPFLMASLAEPANRKLHISYNTSNQWITQPMDLIAVGQHRKTVRTDETKKADNSRECNHCVENVQIVMKSGGGT